MKNGWSTAFAQVVASTGVELSGEVVDAVEVPADLLRRHRAVDLHGVGVVRRSGSRSRRARRCRCPVVSLHGPPGSMPQWSVPKTELRPLMSSRMSTSPMPGQRDAACAAARRASRRPASSRAPLRRVHVRLLDRRLHQHDAARRRAEVGGCVSIAAGRPAGRRVRAGVQRPDAPGARRRPGRRSPCCSSSSRSRRCRRLPVPVSYIQLPVLTPVPAAPLKSSLQVSVKPDGGAGTAAPADALRNAMPAAPTTRVSASIRRRRATVGACM